MQLDEKLKQIGNFAFRYRGYQQLLYTIVFLSQIKHFYKIPDNMAFEFSCVAIVILGLIIRILTVGFVHQNTSGRNVSGQQADELNTTGIYSILRNPLYLGNYLVVLGIRALSQSFTVIVLNSLIFMSIYVPIILVEEAYLSAKFKEKYIDFAKKVNCFIPSFKNFVKPNRKISYSMIIRREHDTWLTSFVGLGLLELVMEYCSHDYIFLNIQWQIMLLVVAIIWLIAKTVKKAGMLKNSDKETLDYLFGKDRVHL